MAVVLSKVTNTHQAMQRSAGLVTVTAAELREADRQIAVRLHTLIKDLAVCRAVHRLDGVVTLFAVRREHGVLVVIPVPGALPKLLIHHQRRFDLAVLFFFLIFANVLLEHLVNRPASRVPKDHAGRLFLQVEQVHTLRQFAVVAFFGFFQE